MIRAPILDPVLLGVPSEQHPSETLDLGAVGRCPGDPTVVIGIVDDSGSVTAPGGVDPISNRYSELEIALQVVARGCRCRQELAAILHFDSPAGDTTALPLTRSGLAGLRASLRIPAGGRGTSNLLPSLLRATELAASYPEHQAVLMVFSDFQLTDGDPEEVIAALTDFPGVVYACVLGRDQGALPGVDHQVDVDHTSLPGAVGRALLTALTHHRTSETEASGGRRGRFHNVLAALPKPPRLTRLTSEASGRAARRTERPPDRRGHGNQRRDGAQ